MNGMESAGDETLAHSACQAACHQFRSSIRRAKEVTGQPKCIGQYMGQGTSQIEVHEVHIIRQADNMDKLITDC